MYGACWLVGLPINQQDVNTGKLSKLAHTSATALHLATATPNTMAVPTAHLICVFLLTYSSALHLAGCLGELLVNRTAVLFLTGHARAVVSSGIASFSADISATE